METFLLLGKSHDENQFVSIVTGGLTLAPAHHTIQDVILELVCG